MDNLSTPPKLSVTSHPLLAPIVFYSRWPQPLGRYKSNESILALFNLSTTQAPITPGPTTKEDIRALLRSGGFKPSGRNKPASEYLFNSVQHTRISPETSINAAVDICNAVSLHSGLPISVIDADRATRSYRIALCPPQTEYVLNPSGQSLDISNLICLHDTKGPCASPVKDSERTKTNAETMHTLSVIWGTRTDTTRTQAAYQWYSELLQTYGITPTPITPE